MVIDFIESYLQYCDPTSMSSIFPTFQQLTDWSGSSHLFLEMMQHMVPKSRGMLLKIIPFHTSY